MREWTEPLENRFIPDRRNREATCSSWPGGTDLRHKKFREASLAAQTGWSAILQQRILCLCFAHHPASLGGGFAISLDVASLSVFFFYQRTTAPAVTRPAPAAVSRILFPALSLPCASAIAMGIVAAELFPYLATTLTVRSGVILSIVPVS